jgi:hypothetical protein
MIICLGWGSLVWDYRELPIHRRWFDDGPFIRVDFLRQSQDNRITLVLHEDSLPVRSLWAVMTSGTLEDAKLALAAREGMTSSNPTKYIGSWSRGDASPTCIHELPAWANAHGVEHVIWTALGPKLASATTARPTKEQVVEHLGALTGTARDNAEKYIRFTPPQIDTEVRRHIEATLGWTSVVGK